jgi:hypothetical protein
MHFGNGAATRCRDVGADGGGALCSDLNTTRFLRRLIEAEKPDLIAFTGAVFLPLSLTSCCLFSSKDDNFTSYDLPFFLPYRMRPLMVSVSTNVPID